MCRNLEAECAVGNSSHFCLGTPARVTSKSEVFFDRQNGLPEDCSGDCSGRRSCEQITSPSAIASERHERGATVAIPHGAKTGPIDELLRRLEHPRPCHRLRHPLWKR